MENQKNSRRDFLKKAAVTGMMAVAVPEIVSASLAAKGVKKYQLGKNNIVLFQGDSITDAGRNRDDGNFNSARALGTGYAMLASARLLERYPDLDIRIYNRGISGNKVPQLADRWDMDCLALKPDVLSIMIGVNDYWHRLNNNYQGTVKGYKDDYMALIERTKKALPSVKLIIGEPYAVPGIRAVDEKWFPDFNGYQKAAFEVAEAYGAVFLPFQKIFDMAQKRAPGVYWTYDGVHPSVAGAQLLANAWLAAVR
jgi:lysophospholipase L1-like esterase